MIVKVKAPSPGESITEVELSSWLIKNGDYVKKGQTIAEIDSDKATLEITSEENGTIKLLVKKGEKIKVGDDLCEIHISKKVENKENINISYQKDLKKKYLNTTASPSARKILREKNIPIKLIKGSGKDGRIIKEDSMIYNTSLYNNYSSNSSYVGNYNCKSYRSKKITPLSSLRKKLSERLVFSKNKTATLTTFNEVNLQEVISIRKKYQDIFFKKHGVKLGFMSFFTLASIRALKLYPDVNSEINENNKITFQYFDINIAMSGPKGLMVPVIKNVENFSFRGIEQEIQRLYKKVQDCTISINDMISGTFTITNGGVFGSMLSTPIINPPQSAILGMHKIIYRAIVVNNNSIEIKPMMYLALSYDHRIIDGRESVGFLNSIKESIENPIKFLINGEKNIYKILEL